MKYALSILSCVLCLVCKAQNDPKDVKFINSVLDTQFFHAKSFYTDSISKSQIAGIKTQLNRDTIFDNNWLTSEIKFIILSKEEKKYINSELDKFKDFTWRQGLVPQFKIIRTDTVNAIFNDRRRGWAYFHTKYGLYIHNFTKPIFLRNNTVCIFYKQYTCDYLCGFGTLDIYILKGGKWVVECQVSSWVS